MNSPRIVLFALTGMGNCVLQALVQHQCPPLLVVTRDEAGIYPYYPVENIAEEARHYGISVEYGETGEHLALNMNVDLALVATYHRILPKKFLKAVPLALNMHPSLLPDYPGRNPFLATIWNGEDLTGITVHRLTERIDGGDIVLQETCLIKAHETQGSLRERLAELAGEMTGDILRIVSSGRCPSRKQGSSRPALFPPPSQYPHILDQADNLATIGRQVRALSPYPGALVPDLNIVVNQVLAIEKVKNVERPFKLGEDRILMPASDGQLLLGIDMRQPRLS